MTDFMVADVFQKKYGSNCPESMVLSDCLMHCMCLSGDDAYKADWMALRRERVGLEAFDMHRTHGLMAAYQQITATWWQNLVTP